MLKEMTGEGCTIEDTDLLRRLRRKSAGALEEAVRQYGAYVMAVIRNRSRDVLTAEDQEEIASDVFVSLWRGGKEHYARAAAPVVRRGGEKSDGGRHAAQAGICAAGG